MENKWQVVVTSVASKSAAKQADIQKGDIILEYNGKEINGDNSYFSSLTPTTEGQESVEMKILRNEKVMPVIVKGGKLGLTVDTERPKGYFDSQSSVSEGKAVGGSHFVTLLGYGNFISGTGWIVVIIGIIAILGGIVSGHEMGFGIAIVAVFFIIFGIIMIVNGQVISCFVAIEKNTRNTYELLKEKNT